MKFCRHIFVFIILSLSFETIEGKTIFVSHYGAYPDDDIDDTSAIQSAIDDTVEDGSITIMDFGPGTYDINSTIGITQKSNLVIKGQGVSETLLLGHFEGVMLFLRGCQNLTLTLFSIDFNPLPFTAGYVVDVNDTYLDLKIVPPHRADVGKQVAIIFRYDPIQMRAAFGPNIYESYQLPPANDTTSLVSPGVLRLPLRWSTKLQKGDPIVVRYKLINHAIFAIDITDMTIQSLNIYSSWMMGFVPLRAVRLNVIDFHVKPFNGRWLSSSADCMHIDDPRESISISNSSCEAMGDDGLNVHGFFYNVSQVIDAKTIVISLSATGWDEILNIGVGTILELRTNQQPYTVHASGTIASITSSQPEMRQITFTDAITAAVGDYACVTGTATLTIRNFTVANNRARGMLLEIRNADIRHSVFNRTSGPAVLFQPSLQEGEGPEGRNITLSENLYFENNEGIAQEKGIITSLPLPIQLVPVVSNILIESSTFYFGNYSQGLVHSSNMNNLYLQGNYIATSNVTSLIYICNSRNLTAENNCLVKTMTKTDQYYTFDETDPCSDSLSDLINLPASAFNSSFPPPV